MTTKKNPAGPPFDAVATLQAIAADAAARRRREGRRCRVLLLHGKTRAGKAAAEAADNKGALGGPIDRAALKLLKGGRRG